MITNPPSPPESAPRYVTRPSGRPHVILKKHTVLHSFFFDMSWLGRTLYYVTRIMLHEIVILKHYIIDRSLVPAPSQPQLNSLTPSPKGSWGENSNRNRIQKSLPFSRYTTTKKNTSVGVGDTHTISFVQRADSWENHPFVHAHSPPPPPAHVPRPRLRVSMKTKRNSPLRPSKEEKKKEKSWGRKTGDEKSHQGECKSGRKYNTQPAQ